MNAARKYSPAIDHSLLRQPCAAILPHNENIPLEK